MVRTLAGIPSLVVDAKATLADLRRAAPADVRETAPGVWELGRSVWVVHGATLVIEAPQVTELRLLSRGARFATISTRDANLRVIGTRSRKLVIRSWQAPSGGPDRDLRNGRGSLSVRGFGRFDAFDAAFLDLGYFEGRLSGVAVTAPRGGVRATGHFRRSDFVGNFFGAYTYEARDIPYVQNRFLRNVVYGLDPHDDSDGFVVRDNLAARNGRHGIIFSRLCDHNLVTHNVSVQNGWHGIVIDDGKLADGPSNDNRVVGNTVRGNGKVGISVDGSGDNQVLHNRVDGQPIGIRVYGPALGNTVRSNSVSGAARIGIFVDAPASSNAIEENRLARTATAIGIRGAHGTVVEENSILSADGHGVSVVPSQYGTATRIAVVDNEIDGAGSSPIRVGHPQRVRSDGNRVSWRYEPAHVIARVLGWGVGPSLWLIIFGAALIGPAVFRIGDRATRRRRLLRIAAAGALLAAVASVTVRLLSSDPAWRSSLAVPGSPPDPRLGRPGAVSSDAAPLALRVISKAGHATHPTWYHDSQVGQAGREVVVAWNGVHDVRAARLRASDLRIIDKAKLSSAKLGGAVDSTGTDTKRHDIPAVVVDDAGLLHFLYGGGTIAGLRLGNGPYYRATTRRAELGSLTPEQALDIGGGAAFDFESVTDSAGVRHIIGQRGRGNTGSLIELRMTPRGRWLPPRQIIRAGFRPNGCVLGGQPRGCNIFAISRLAAGPDRTLSLVWGVSEASLSGKCHTDSGFCDNDLFYAVSHDAGATWSDVSGGTRVTLGPGSALQADDPRFRIAAGHIGLFKAIADGPRGTLIVYSRVGAHGGSLVAARRAGGRWRTSVIARPGDLAAKSWKGSLVLRGDRAGYTLWTPTGDRLIRFTSRDGITWHPLVAYRGAVWSLTGTSSHTRRRRELVMWRGARHGKRSQVIAAILPAGG
jgi:parallel beta-helix repeat protein